jgi:predicted phosphatase
MFAVYFFENKNLLLSQLLKRVPSEGEDLTIKGRKGKVSSVNIIDEKNIHVQVILENITKNKLLVDNSLKKKGK